MAEALVISDLHLGSENCQAKELTAFLEEIESGSRRTQKLILNGDVFDSIDFRRLNKNHWKVLSLLRKLSDRIQIIWINGNHDGPAEIVSHLLGVIVQNELILESGGKRILFHHGHRFDRFINDHPLLTATADLIYRVLQRIDSTHHFARSAKRKSKTFLRCAGIIEAKSIEYARKKNCQAVACGHTHHAEAKVEGMIGYFNSGCWTEKPCHFLKVEQGKVSLHAYLNDSGEQSLDELTPLSERLVELTVAV